MKVLYIVLVVFACFLSSYKVPAASAMENAEVKSRMESYVPLEYQVRVLYEGGATVTQIFDAALNMDFNPYQIIIALLKAGAPKDEVVSAAIKRGILKPVVYKALADSDIDPMDQGLGFSPILANGPAPLIIGLPTGMSSAKFVSVSVPAN